ncbi:MAG TPA: glycosyltransferase family 1 protein [Candidatus Nanoarchaeia archaeon]|nr:glycosyltransferase family 1 protein [Candidatus Nanoarchaeia archaeon]
MLIGIDASRANRTHKSGTEWYSYYLIKYFARLDKENQFILYTDQPLSPDLVDLTTLDFLPPNQDSEPAYDAGGYQIIKSPHHNFKGKVLRWPFSYFWTLGRLSLFMITNKPDVLFIPAHGIPLARPKRTVNTIHDVAFKREAGVYEENKLGPRRGRGSRMINFLVRLLTGGRYGANSTDYLNWSTEYSLKHSDRIITVSQSTKDEILKVYRADDSKITVIHNGFNDRLYKKINDEKKIGEVLEKYGLIRPYFLYVGRLEKKKNTPLLIEAFVKFKHHYADRPEKLALIGDASFGFDEIKYIVHEFGLQNEVIMPGWANEEDIAYIFNGAAAFILPSLHEGFGITVLQALACGVPTVASDIPVLREVAGGAAIYFDPRDKDNLAEAMEKIVADGALRAKLIARGLERAKEFSWEKCAKETLDCLTGSH